MEVFSQDALYAKRKNKAPESIGDRMLAVKSTSLF
jgi:hypothetical protein